MKTLKIDINNIQEEEIDIISDYFLRGKTIIYPTDTVYGLGCIATDEKAIKKIEKIKNRSKQKSYILLTKSFCMTNKYAKVDKKQDEFLRSVWVARTNSAKVNEKNGKNPTTVILEARENMLPSSVLKDGSVAFRLPKNDFLSKMLVRVNLPLISTSLNISGKEPLRSLDKIEKYFDETVLPDLLVDAGRMAKVNPSQIIDIRNIKDVKKIR